MSFLIKFYQPRQALPMQPENKPSIMNDPVQPTTIKKDYLNPEMKAPSSFPPPINPGVNLKKQETSSLEKRKLSAGESDSEGKTFQIIYRF